MQCVYTVLLGGYESLTEQPVARTSAITFICLTDDPTLTSTTWDVKLVDPVLPQDSIRSQRYLKIMGHPLLKEFTQSLYIDNSVRLTRAPEEIFQKYGGRSPLALPLHSFRGTVREEFQEVIALHLDDPDLVANQRKRYEDIAPEILRQKPYWTAILLRDHTHPGIPELMGKWWDEVLNYSRRDQLSINACISMVGLNVLDLEIRNSKSWFHRWPVAKGKKDEIRFWRGQVPDKGSFGRRVLDFLLAKLRRL